MTDESPPSVFGPGAAGLDVRGDHHAAFRSLRQQAPVLHVKAADCWVVTGHAQARSMLRDPRVSAYFQPSSTEVPPGAHPFLRQRAHALRLFRSFLHERAPAEHQQLRKLVRPFLSPGAVAGRRVRAQAIVDERIGTARAIGRMDVVGDLARPLAVNTVCDLMGIPTERRERAGDLARSLASFFESGPDKEGGLMSMIALASELQGLIATWRLSLPAEDNLLWALARAEARGELTEDDVLGNGAMILFAGHLTSQHLISSAVAALLEHPDQWDLLKAHPDLIDTAVDEFLRYEPPVPVAPRWATADIALENGVIRQGERILVLFGAANRDPEVFDDPDRLDITRSPNPHLGLGYDAHYCVGAALGRLEAQVAIGTLAREVPSLELGPGGVQWEQTTGMRGPAALPVRLP